MDAPSSREQKAAEIEREVAKGEVQSTDEAVPYFKLFSGADKVDVLLMFVGTIGSIGAGLGWPIFTILFADFTDSFGSGNASDFTSLGRSLSLNFVYVAVGTAVASFLEVGFWMWTGHRQTRRLRQRYCSALLKQEVAFFDVEGTAGGLLQGLVDDTALIQTAISERVGNFVHNTASFIAGLAIAFWASWELALVMLGCLPFLGIVGAFAARLTDQFTRQSNVIYAEANGTVLEALGQIRTVTAYNQQEWTSEQYKNKLVVPQKVGLRQGLVNGFVVGAVNFVMFCTMAAAFYFGAYRVADNKRTGGDVLTALLSALIGGFALGMAAPNFQHFAKGRAAGAKVFHIIDRHSAIDVDKAGQKLTSLEGRLMLNNVNFAYPARPDSLVLRDFSLSIPAGRTVALVGSSGSGKSTVVGLIERFYDPMEGSVTLDGVDLRQLDLLWLRSNIGLVSQEPTLFATTIYENIALGKPGATREEVIAAATAANAHGFISALHHGYDTDVGERGLQMSGGQKQRIAIARAVLKNPRVLLLDEATSALDVHSERIVQRALDNVMVGRTTVVIAHRLSTVRHAHVIAVVSQGQVVEQGTHEELLKKDDGAYMALVRMQLQKETENEDDDELDEELDVVLEELEGASGSGQGEDGEEVQVEIPFSKGPSTREGGDDGLAGKDVELGRLRRRLSEDGARLSRELKKGSRELHDGKRTSKDLKRTSLEGRRPSQDVKHPPETLDLVATSGTKDKEDSMDKNKKPVRVPISRLAALNKPEWAYALVGFLSAAAVGSVQPLFALLFTEMIRVLYLPDKEEKRQEASLYSWMFFVLGVGSIVFATIMHYCFGAMAQKLVARLRLMMLGAILRQDIGWFDLPGNTSGALASRLSTDAMYIRGAVGDALGLIGQYTACLITGFVIAFIYDWRMALVVTGVLPLMVVATAIENKSQLGGVGSTDKNYSAANQVVTDALGAIRVIQSYNLQQYIDDLYDYHLGVITAKMSKRSLISGLSLGYSGFCTFALYGLVIWFAGIEVERGWSSFDDVMKSFMAVTLAAMGLAQAQMDFPHLSKAGPAVQRVFPIIDRVPAIDWHKTEGLEPKEIKGELELQHVKFVYPARPTITVLHDFSLSIPAGRTVALVGSSGSGKSTVVGLIERFYDPVQGQVLLDGVDLRSYHLPWLRAQVGLVSQEPLLFSTTILNNIRYGNPAATMEEVIEAAKIASAEEFIERLADGYNTLVGERGVLLSGGQKQRIAIARAVVRNPRIMLLDEATSALDAQSEKVVQAALDRVMVGRTSVVVAHRLSTIRNADIIAVVSEGRLQEQGKHEELIAHDGAYAKLVQLQMASAMSG